MTNHCYYTIPRNSLAWMLAAHVAAIIPHTPRMSYWLIATAVICMLWRIMVYRGEWHFPGRWMRTALVVVGGAAIIVDYGASIGPEAGVALLIFSFSMKLLEMHHQRDAYLLVVLAYFVVATELLFNTNMAMTLYLLAAMLMITSALIGLHQTCSYQKPTAALKLALIIVLQAAPVMLALFIFFPRMPPLWALEVSAAQGTKGLSDTMTPADMARLGQVDNLAFRAEFRGNIPPNNQLYWRGLVFSYFDGKTWSADKVHRVLPRSDVKHISLPYQYSVVLEPTGQNYLFALDMPVVEQGEINFTHDFRLVRNTKINQLYRYELTSYLNYEAQTELSPRIKQSTLQLPKAENERSLELARQWIEEAAYDPSAYIQRVLNWFNQEFIYTLKPPALADNIIDRFLLDTKKGYCAHYASALVYMMRAAGIPARVVAGYLGGERNPLGNYVQVHQFEAHAWAEVWLQGRGWIRVDPTSAVAPERVLDGVESALEKEGSFLEDQPFSPMRYRSNPLVKGVLNSIDYLSFKWNRSVVGFDAEKQKAFLANYFSAITPEKMAVLMMALLGLIFLALALIMFRIKPSVRKNEADRVYLALCDYLALRGVGREIGETPFQYARRVSKQMPAAAEPIAWITRRYMQLQYQPLSGRALRQKQFVAEVKKILRDLKR